MVDEGEVRRLLTRAIHEALEAHVTPAVSQSLLRDALTRSSLERPPSDSREAELFLSRGLLPAATQILGAETAESILDEIGRTVDLITRKQTRPVAPRASTTAPPASGQRLTPRQTRPRADVSTAPSVRRTLTPLPRGAARSETRRSGAAAREVTPSDFVRNVAEGAAPSSPRPLRFLAATLDPQLLSALSTAVGASGILRSVRSVFGLVRAVEAAAGGRIYILLDVASPGVRPEALAALAEDLADVTVVLCRTAGELDARLADISSLTCAWVRLSERQDVHGVAEGCARLVS